MTEQSPSPPSSPEAPTMAADVKLLPLPELPRQVEGYNSDYWEAGQIEEYAADYARANVAHATAALQAKIEALRAEVERLNRLLGRIVEGDGDSTLTIRAGTDALETDLWRCTVCGQVGTVGRCCGEETREPFHPLR